MKKILIFISTLILMLSFLTGCTEEPYDSMTLPRETAQNDAAAGETKKYDNEIGKNDISAGALKKAEEIVEKDGVYTTPALVAAYIRTFNKLPSNYITKNEAIKLGWDSREGNLQRVAPGKSIGGDNFGNYEKLLPNGKYRECDVNYEGGRRNSERIIYSTGGDVYYTSDHYNSFTRLY